MQVTTRKSTHTLAANEIQLGSLAHSTRAKSCRATIRKLTSRPTAVSSFVSQNVTGQISRFLPSPQTSHLKHNASFPKCESEGIVFPCIIHYTLTTDHRRLRNDNARVQKTCNTTDDELCRWRLCSQCTVAHKTDDARTVQFYSISTRFLRWFFFSETSDDGTYHLHTVANIPRNLGH